MKLTKAAIKWFENDQQESGTETALFNFVFGIASDLLHGADPTLKTIKLGRFRSGNGNGAKGKLSTKTRNGEDSARRDKVLSDLKLK